MLHFRQSGEGGEPVVILHGLFGSGDNWLTHAKSLSDKYHLVLPDQRNHGRSFHSNDFDYDLMASDLLELTNQLGFSKFHLIGHSMGGKTAMKFAIKFPEKIKNLMIVDIAPKAYPPHHQVILDALFEVHNSEINARKEAEEIMGKHIQELGVKQFLLKNLERKDDNTFGWRINLEGIASKIENVGTPLDSTEKYNGFTLFVRGNESNYILDEDKANLKYHFPNSKLLTIKNAGHWVHAEQPQIFINTIKEFLKFTE